MKSPIRSGLLIVTVVCGFSAIGALAGTQDAPTPPTPPSSVAPLTSFAPDRAGSILRCHPGCARCSGDAFHACTAGCSRCSGEPRPTRLGRLGSSSLYEHVRRTS
jgi:hypothetical protein